MKNMKKLFILLNLLAFTSTAFAQKDAAKFLRGKKHYKKVVKETQKLEKVLGSKTPEETLEEEEIQAQKATLEPPPPEPTPAPVEAVVQPAEASPPLVASEEQKSIQGLIFSAVATGNVHVLLVQDEYGRNLKLMSYPGIGGFTALGYRFGNYFALIGDFSIDRIIFDNFDTFIITQDHIALMTGRLAARFYITPSFNIDLMGGIKQNYVVHTTSLSGITVERLMHGLVGLGLNYSIIELKNFLMSGRTDFEIYLPKTQGSWKTDVGLGAFTELRLGVPIADRSSFYMKLGGGYLNVKPSIATQYGIVGFMGIGFTIEN